MKKYYEIHVNIPKNGYSVAIVSDKELEETEIINQAINENKFEECNDTDFIDYIGEISEEEYNTSFNF